MDTCKTQVNRAGGGDEQDHRGDEDEAEEKFGSMILVNSVNKRELGTR